LLSALSYNQIYSRMVRAKVTGKVKAKSRVEAKKDPGKNPSVASGRKQEPVLTGSCCCECGEVVGDDTKALQCERCVVETWKCAVCLGFSDEFKNPLHWFCPKCEESLFQHPSHMSDKIADTLTKLNDKTQGIEQRLFENFDRIEQQLMGRINAVEQMLEKKAAIAKLDEFQKNMEVKVESIIKSLNSKSDDSVQVKEVHERLEQKVDALANNVGMTVAAKDTVEDFLLAKLHDDKLEEKKFRSARLV